MPRLEEFLKENDYEYEITCAPPKGLYLRESIQEFERKVLKLSEKWERRDYQLDTLVHCANNNRAVVVSPTGSGKSLMIYELMSFYSSIYNNYPRALLIVPNVGLIHQMEKDFRDYGCIHSIQKIYSGQSHIVRGHFVITTWQSIYENGYDWFDQFKVVIVDEVHHAKAKSLVALMEKTYNIPYKFGFTATLDELPTSRLVIEGLFGPVYVAAKQRELMDAGFNSQIKINAIILKHPADHSKALYKTKYKDELDWLIENGKRNRFIVDLAKTLSGNTLVLYRYVEKQGIPLHNMIRVSAIDRPIYLVHGLVAADERNAIREIVDREKNSITVASTGCFSEGVNIPNINNIIFASPSKSRILVMQSIGRGLRKTDSKSVCNLYDIGDDLTYKKRKNFSFKHMMQRLEYYINEEFPYNVHKVEL